MHLYLKKYISSIFRIYTTCQTTKGFSQLIYFCKSMRKQKDALHKKNVKLFFTLVVRTGGYMAEGSGFDSDSGSWKYRYFSMVTFTLPYISLVQRSEFKQEWILWLNWPPVLTRRRIFSHLFGLSVPSELPELHFGSFLHNNRLPSVLNS